MKKIARHKKKRKSKRDEPRIKNSKVKVHHEGRISDAAVNFYAKKIVSAVIKQKTHSAIWRIYARSGMDINQHLLCLDKAESLLDEEENTDKYLKLLRESRTKICKILNINEVVNITSTYEID